MLRGLYPLFTFLLESMEYIHNLIKFYRVNSSIGIAQMIVSDFQHRSPVKACQWFGIDGFLAFLFILYDISYNQSMKKIKVKITFIGPQPLVYLCWYNDSSLLCDIHCYQSCRVGNVFLPTTLFDKWQANDKALSPTL